MKHPGSAGSSARHIAALTSPRSAFLRRRCGPGWLLRPETRTAQPAGRPHDRVRENPSSAEASGGPGASGTQARPVRPAARDGVLRRRGAGADPGRQRTWAVRRSADPPDQRGPVHLRHRLDHPVGGLLEGRGPAAAAAGRDVRRRRPDDRHRGGRRWRHRRPCRHLRRGHRRRTGDVLRRALLRQDPAVLPTGGHRFGDHHHRDHVAAGRRQRRHRHRHVRRHREPDPRPDRPQTAGLLARHPRADRADPAILQGLHRQHRGVDRSGRRDRRGLLHGRRALR